MQGAFQFFPHLKWVEVRLDPSMCYGKKIEILCLQENVHAFDCACLNRLWLRILSLGIAHQMCNVASLLYPIMPLLSNIRWAKLVVTNYSNYEQLIRFSSILAYLLSLDSYLKLLLTAEIISLSFVCSCVFYKWKIVHTCENITSRNLLTDAKGNCHFEWEVYLWCASTFKVILSVCKMTYCLGCFTWCFSLEGGNL